MFENPTPPINSVAGPFLYESSNITLFIKQLAVNEPILGGNKLFKLKHNLIKARALGKKMILTFGGAFSNHIAAMALTGEKEGFKTLGIIRGEPASISNVTLSRAAANGMKFIFLSREDYRSKNDPALLSKLIPDIENYYIIPEGGANAEGVQGCMEIFCEEDNIFDYITVSCGTGTTAAGMILSMKPHQKLIGFSVLRDNGFLEKEIGNWLDKFHTSIKPGSWEVNHDFDFGGYAKTNVELNSYCDNFKIRTGIAIEPVYTGKMFYGLEKLIASGHFKYGSKILAIHTGGMQYLK